MNFPTTYKVSYIGGLHDVTCSEIEHVEVEVVRAPAGHDVVYVHVDGMTIFRLCRPATCVVKDRRFPKLGKKGTYNSKYRRQPYQKKKKPAIMTPPVGFEVR